jgi:alpha-mannosidase
MMTKPPRYIFHILPNAHLDPVWLWDWREGLNEGVVTTRTLLDLMDEYPDLTFMRGEAALYQHLERTDPVTFARLSRQIAAGRWEVVGGTLIQPDTNLPATEVFARHLLLGQRYFMQRFGKRVRVAWAADSFGHTAGLPEILTAAGIEGFSFGRPDNRQLPLSKPAFWWEAASGARVLAYRIPVGWYGAERHELPGKLDAALVAASAGDLLNVGVYFGLGNHGGGPTRRQIEDIHRWAEAHPEVKVVFSGLHRLIEALRKEAELKGAGFLPVHRGEMNFCLRGCYASQARFKYAYRRAEASLFRGETVDAVVGAKLGRSCARLNEAWEGLLFNSFHDILPGSSIERAYTEQLEWLGGGTHAARRAEHDALNALAAKVDTRVPAVRPDHPSAVSLLVFNPHPHEYRGPLELEASLDYRPIWPYQDRADEVPVEVRGPDRKPVPHQIVATEHSSMPGLPWRKRVVVSAVLPPMGWSLYEMGWVEGARVPKTSAPASATSGTIRNGFYRVSARPGHAGVQVFRKGKAVLDVPGLHCVTVADPWGSWGNMQEEPEAMNLSEVVHRWKVTAVETLERGPERAILWVCMEGGASRLELSFCLYSRREAVDVQARLFWNERSARLKMVLPAGDRADYEVPGGMVQRGAVGEVPGGRWVRVRGKRGTLGFASDALYCFDGTEGALRVSVVRATRYANDVKTAPTEELWRPATDQGEHVFRFLLSPGGSELQRLADELERVPVAILTAPHEGALARSGSLMALEPATVRLLALKPAEDGRGFVLRVQEAAGRKAVVGLRWLGQRIRLGPVGPREIATWRIRRAGKGWRGERSDIVER